MTKLTWVDGADGLDMADAWSDQLHVGTVIQRADGTWWFDCTYATKMSKVPGALGSGKVATLDEAKAAVEKDWATWLQFAGLMK